MSRYIIRQFDYANWKELGQKHKFFLKNVPLISLTADFITDETSQLSLWLTDDISKNNLAKLAATINGSGTTTKLYNRHFLIFDTEKFRRKVLKFTPAKAESIVVDMRESHVNTQKILYTDYKRLVKTMINQIANIIDLDSVYISTNDIKTWYKNEFLQNPSNLDFNNPKYLEIHKKYMK